jgi:hypothetical protein
MCNKSTPKKVTLEEVLVPFTIGSGLLLVLGYRLICGRTTNTEVEGFLIGLFFGQVGPYLYAMCYGNAKHKRLFYYYTLFIIFGLVFVLALISKQLPFGYVAGFGFTSCFGYSLFAFLRKRSENADTRERREREILNR